LAKAMKNHEVKWQRHTVQSGESLSTIARRYGVAVTEIARLNSIKNQNRISVGDNLIIPTQPGRFNLPVDPPKPTTAPSYHVVRPGENLWNIAKRYGISSSTLVTANGIRERQTIHPGDRLIIPGSGYTPKATAAKETKKPEIQTYTVRKGDTIWSIAKVSQISVREIQKANNLDPNGLIRPGDVLKIPIHTNQ